MGEYVWRGDVRRTTDLTLCPVFAPFRLLTMLPTAMQMAVFEFVACCSFFFMFTGTTLFGVYYIKQMYSPHIQGRVTSHTLHRTCWYGQANGITPDGNTTFEEAYWGADVTFSWGSAAAASNCTITGVLSANHSQTEALSILTEKYAIGSTAELFYTPNGACHWPEPAMDAMHLVVAVLVAATFVASIILMLGTGWMAWNRVLE